ncbi:cupin domain-containing protein [Facilibium subflavum]|uniref:cupin domain-containing protein n=1 Tax=Facilibium subflavum TaxID=2219058 RepID=UPI0013C37336|nr:cupin domain-containing protein [Facilibium subflavum]
MIRRVVTTIKDNGKSSILQDMSIQNVQAPLPDIMPDFKFYNIWSTDVMPVNLKSDTDPTYNRYIPTQPLANGSMFRVVDYPPENQLMTLIKKMNTDELAAFEKSVGVKLILDGPHPFMHVTDSIDYGIVLEGEIFLVLDEDETLVKKGDIVIQKGTNHAWSNRSSSICRMAYVLLDGL